MAVDQAFLNKYGTWAIVTGASSGIGEQFARLLAVKGVNLVLVARRRARLTRLGNELAQAHGIQFRVVGVDLTSADFEAEIEAATIDLEIGLLVNNAGYSITGNFLDGDVAEQEKLVDLHVKAPMLLSHTFGRKMRSRGRGGIIFVSSIVGYTGTPKWANYAASKAFVLQFGEALHMEMKSVGVDVLTVVPGQTKTEFAESAELNRLVLPMEALDVARIALNRLGSRAVVVTGFRNNLFTFGTRFFPRAMNSTVAGALLNYLYSKRV